MTCSLKQASLKSYSTNILFKRYEHIQTIDVLYAMDSRLGREIQIHQVLMSQNPGAFGVLVL